MTLLSRIAIFLIGISSVFTTQCMASSRTSYSQASQDRFVYLLLYGDNKQDDGYYLEIGAGHPVNGNNSYFFEKHLGWKGASIDIITDLSPTWYASRQNTLLIEDATHSNYTAILDGFPEAIDYLSLDIDDNYDVVLQQIPFDKHIFKVITIEHDAYRFGNKYRDKERKILENLGYYLLCSDISILLGNRYCAFEDWWIHPDMFSTEYLMRLKSIDLNNKSHDQAIHIIQTQIGKRF